MGRAFAAMTPVIQAQSFRFAYPGAARPAVRDLTFTVEQGEIFGFLGPSGAGKSTTQNVLIRLLHGYEGSVAVFGRDLHAWDRRYYRRIGVAFESPNHYLKLTARENLRLFVGLHGRGTENPDTLLERVGLLEDGDKRVGEFSKGMRGRLTLARALLRAKAGSLADSPMPRAVRQADSLSLVRFDRRVNNCDNSLPTRSAAARAEPSRTRLTPSPRVL